MLFDNQYRISYQYSNDTETNTLLVQSFKFPFLGLQSSISADLCYRNKINITCEDLIINAYLVGGHIHEIFAGQYNGGILSLENHKVNLIIERIEDHFQVQKVMPLEQVESYPLVAGTVSLTGANPSMSGVKLPSSDFKKLVAELEKTPTIPICKLINCRFEPIEMNFTETKSDPVLTSMVVKFDKMEVV